MFLGKSIYVFKKREKENKWSTKQLQVDVF